MPLRRPDLVARLRTLSAACAAVALIAAVPKGMDPVNPSCPKLLGWSEAPKMTFAVRDTPDGRVLVGEGGIDEGMALRLADALKRNPDVGELWLRSPGGSAETGNAAGTLLRKQYRGLTTRVPKDWACFSACNFVFMGGSVRVVDPGGQFVVHMFTHVGDRENVKGEIADDLDGAVDLISDIEQSSAQLASDDNDFLIRMGVSRKLLTEIMYKQKAAAGKGPDRSTRRCLTQAELTRYGVTNASTAQ